MDIKVSYVADGESLVTLDYAIQRGPEEVIEQIQRLIPKQAIVDDGTIKTSLTITVAGGTPQELLKANLSQKTLSKVNKALGKALMDLNDKHSG